MSEQETPVETKQTEETPVEEKQTEETPVESSHINVASVVIPTRSCGSVFIIFSKPRQKRTAHAGLAPYDENEPDRKPVDKKKVNKMKRLFGF